MVSLSTNQKTVSKHKFKKALIYVFLILFMIFAIIIIEIIHNGKQKENHHITLKQSNSNKHTVLFNGSYYYIEEGKLVSENNEKKETIYSCAKYNTIIGASQNHLFLIQNASQNNTDPSEIIVLNENGSIENSFKIQERVIETVSDKDTLYILTDRNLYSINAASNTIPVIVDMTEDLDSVKDDNHFFEYVGFKQLENGIIVAYKRSENDRIHYVLFDKDHKKCSDGINQYGISYYDDKNVFFLNTEGDTMSIDIRSGEVKKYTIPEADEENWGCVLGCACFGNKMYINIGINSNPADPFGFTNTLAQGKKGKIYLFNLESNKVENKVELRKYERCIFIAPDNYVTYYENEYHIYSTKTNKEIRTLKANEIKNDKSFSFETCGEYVFVFDDDTGECINRIKV